MSSVDVAESFAGFTFVMVNDELAVLTRRGAYPHGHGVPAKRLRRRTTEKRLNHDHDVDGRTSGAAYPDSVGAAIRIIPIIAAWNGTASPGCTLALGK